MTREESPSAPAGAPRRPSTAPSAATCAASRIPASPWSSSGEGGVTPAVVKAVEAALASHELIKVRLRQPADKQAAARQLADESHAALCGVLGHTVVLYRPDPEAPEIKLPQRG